MELLLTAAIFLVLSFDWEDLGFLQLLWGKGRHWSANFGWKLPLPQTPCCKPLRSVLDQGPHFFSRILSAATWQLWPNWNQLVACQEVGEPVSTTCLLGNALVLQPDGWSSSGSALCLHTFQEASTF